MQTYKWLTYQDENKSALELNAKVIRFLADSGLEIFSLSTSIRMRNEYKVEGGLFRDYDSEGLFSIVDEDQEKLETYLNDHYDEINPDFPTIISVTFHKEIDETKKGEFDDERDS